MTKTIIYLGFLLIIIIAFFSLNWQKIETEKGLPKKANQISVKAHAFGKFWLKIKEEKVSVNKPLTLLIYADSSSEPITGFDIVLKYDNKSMKFQNFTSFLSDYQFFKIINEGELRITTVKKPDPSTLTLFKETVIGEIQFLPFKKGENQINFVFSPESKTDSNLITDKTEDILREVKNITFSIE